MHEHSGQGHGGQELVGEAGKLGKWVFAVNIALAVAAIGTSAVGWHRIGYPWSDVAFHSIKSLEMDEVYNRLEMRGEDAPRGQDEPSRPRTGTDSQSAESGREFLNIGRFIGVLFAIFLTASTIAVVFRQQWMRARVRWNYRGHCIVIGSTPLADSLARAAGGRVVHFRNSDDSIAISGHTVRMPICADAAHALRQGAAHKARSILIAMDDDMAAIDLALEIQRRSAVFASPPRVILRLHDYWLAHSFHHLPRAERIEAVSLPALVARDAMRRFPPYLSAADQGASRVHLLLFGEPDWLEAMMSEALLSAGTLTFGRPAITFGCADSVAFRARLLERYPEIALEADLAFIDLVGSRPWELPGLDMATLPSGQVTAVFCLFPKSAQSICAFLGFEQASRAVKTVTAPVFVLTDGHEFPDPPPGSALNPQHFVPIGGPHHIVRAFSLDADTPERAEQKYHAAYLEFANPGGDAAKPWKDIKEDYRISNRRAVAHIPAKLFDAGFDLRAWMATADVWSQLPSLALSHPLFRSSEERDRLAMLEHNRWMADRRLNGWRYGSARDNAARIHTDLVPFDDLPVDIQDYDRQFIDLLARIIAHETTGIRRADQADTITPGE